jgi:hypothetical protein
MHFWSNFIVWGFLVDVGIIVVRFFKTARYYKEIHAAIFSIITAFSLFVGFWIV